LDIHVCRTYGGICSNRDSFRELNKVLVSFRVSCDGESRWDNFFAWQTGGFIAHEAELNHAILGASISIERVAIIARLANDDTITAFVLTFILLVKDEAGINEFAFHALV
jgi:hypothetical protein